METCEATYTIGDYLKGRVRGISVPDNALLSICADVQIEPTTPFVALTEKEKDLSLAWFYVWLAGGPIQTGSAKDSDADWSHSEGGERMSAGALKRYLDMANEIFDKYDLPLIGAPEKWGFVGRGIHNPRRYR